MKPSEVVAMLYERVEGVNREQTIVDAFCVYMKEKEFGVDETCAAYYAFAGGYKAAFSNRETIYQRGMQEGRARTMDELSEKVRAVILTFIAKE